MAILTSILALVLAQQPARPGEVVEGVIHRDGDEQYRLAFDTSGPTTVEVSGIPGDCAIQVGSKGFQDSDSSPVDWTDGQPGQAVRHTFSVQAGRPGTIWVQLRSRVSGVSQGRWSGIACSSSGPYYTAPERGAPGGASPGAFEGRPVRAPISFRLVAGGTGAPAAAGSTGAPAALGRAGILRDERLGYALDYPQDWSPAAPEGGTSRLAAGDALVTVTVVPKSAVPNASDMVILLRLHERLTDMGAELTKLGPTTFGGQEALFASHVYDDRNSRGQTVPFDHLQLVVDHDASYYLVAFVAPHDVFVKQTAAFKKMFASWRFLQ